MHLLSLVLGLLACTDYNIEKQGNVLDGNEDDAAPDIEVAPPSITFGDVAVGADTTAFEVVTVSNVGDAALQISALRLEDASAPYTISAISSVLVEPGGAATFTVTFEPMTSGATATRVLIPSNDPDEPEVAVRLDGNGIAPAITVTPDTYDFGSLYIGCDNAVPLTIKNVGNADLEVTGFEYVSRSDDLAFDADTETNGAPPWVMAPNEERTVYVGYGPLDEIPDDGFLKISSNDPFRPEAQASQVGGGALFGEKLDLFEQPIKGLTDIVFTVDWSCSMADDIARVQSNFDVFIGTLTAMDADYHVAVVTDDDGCVNGSQPYIDNTMSTSDQQALFDTMLNDYAYGAYTEMGFTLLEAATTSTALSGCNEDMLRDDATLAMVGVTDEVEQSANPWSYYVSLFQGLKADPDDVVIHAIAGDYPAGCGGNEPGQGWYEASIATGGLFLSICATDWASHLEALAEGSAADLTSFALTQTPVPDSIVVRVDGITQSTGWTYDGSSNVVKFDETNVPEGGSTIEVEYALFGDCSM